MSNRIAKEAPSGASLGNKAASVLPAAGKGLPGLKREGKMPTNYGYEPSRGTRRLDRRKGFKAARKKRVRSLEGKARKAREQIKFIEAKE